ncbi:chalcone synthase [Exophiala viscosa]|uniref:Chalcone synthase n=1 Tax=Exophiala viscosa TaxID=2486360 RepID=A0AAN6E693_9EURO|nr:chalcone synthase [Exophiala viscosa]KAI1626985.1 chalcone synthase [Exophiala viscosa]
MSPAAVHNKVTPPYQRPDLYIYGTGVEYPPYEIKPENLETLARRFYPKTPALDKVLTINEYTGIDSRSAIGTIDHPIANAPEAPTIAELCDVFLDHGVKLSVAACRKALEQWGGDLSEITHVVATTCTNSANPGYDHYVVKQLGLNQSIEKVLLHGIGCSGGLNALRTAANIALGSSFRRKPARVLVLACEISSTLVRSELDSIHKNQEVRIGVTLFSDCASAVVLGNGFSDRYDEEPLLELLGWDHRIIEDTEKDLGFDVDPLGWKVVLTPRVPKLAAAAVPAMYEDLVSSIPELVDLGKFKASDYDWALHPGGATVLSGVERAMKLKPELLRASYEVYITHGNSSSATFFSVLNRLLQGETTEHIIGCAFGPGIAVEMMVFKRSNQVSEAGTVSPTETLVAEDVD